jgi:hypothetical protein
MHASKQADIDGWIDQSCTYSSNSSQDGIIQLNGALVLIFLSNYSELQSCM